MVSDFSEQSRSFPSLQCRVPWPSIRRRCMTTTANHGCPTQRRLLRIIMCQNASILGPPPATECPLPQLLRLELTFCLQLHAFDGTLDCPRCVSTTAPNTLAVNTGAPLFVDSRPPNPALNQAQAVAAVGALDSMSNLRRRLQLKHRTLCRLALTSGIKISRLMRDQTVCVVEAAGPSRPWGVDLRELIGPCRVEAHWTSPHICHFSSPHPAPGNLPRTQVTFFLLPPGTVPRALFPTLAVSSRSGVALARSASARHHCAASLHQNPRLPLSIAQVSPSLCRNAGIHATALPSLPCTNRLRCGGTTRLRGHWLVRSPKFEPSLPAVARALPTSHPVAFAGTAQKTNMGP